MKENYSRREILFGSILLGAAVLTSCLPEISGSTGDGKTKAQPQSDPVPESHAKINTAATATMKSIEQSPDYDPRPDPMPDVPYARDAQGTPMPVQNQIFQGPIDN